MIELCTKRRMILSVVILGVLTILVLIFEEVLTSELLLNDEVYIQNTTRLSIDTVETNGDRTVLSDVDPTLPGYKKCWLNEPFTVAKECSFCTDFELSSKTPAACAESGMKETIRCGTSGTMVYRSCTRIPSLENRRFWIFQSLVLLSLVISYGVVRLRWSQLERRTVKAIERRLAAGH